MISAGFLCNDGKMYTSTYVTGKDTLIPLKFFILILLRYISIAYYMIKLFNNFITL